MADVSVLVPVYNAAPFVAATLDSILAQTLRELRVIVSVDAGDDASAEVCRRYLADPRVELVVQPARLGWVGNVNALIARAETPFFCIAPHDDLLDPRYLAAARAELAAHPAASCVYGDIQTFGARRLPLSQPPIHGATLDRLVSLLLHHYAAVAFRGLVRRGSAADRPLLPTGLRGDFAADTVWMVELAGRGELRRLDRVTCAKRLWPRWGRHTPVHRSWLRLPRHEVLARWVDHCVACARRALAYVESPDERRLIVTAAHLRLVGIGRARADGLRLRSGREQEAATAAFEASFPVAEASAEARANALAGAGAGALREAWSAAATPPRLRRWATRHAERVADMMR